MQPNSPVPDYEIQRAVPWSDDIPYKRGLLTVEGASFNRYIKDWCQPLGDVPAYPGRPVGNLQFGLRPLPNYVSRSRWMFSDKTYMTRSYLSIDKRNRNLGAVQFTCPVNIPILHSHGDPWMSITPSEILSCRTALRHAAGRVLMGGLGLGWLARKVLARDQVTDLTIVEREQDVLDYFGAPLHSNGKPVQKVCGDAFEYAGKHWKKFDSILFDVWRWYGDARCDDRWQIIKRNAREAHIRTWDWD